MAGGTLPAMGGGDLAPNLARPCSILPVNPPTSHLAMAGGYGVPHTAYVPTESAVAGRGGGIARGLGPGHAATSTPAPGKGGSMGLTPGKFLIH